MVNHLKLLLENLPQALPEKSSVLNFSPDPDILEEVVSRVREFMPIKFRSKLGPGLVIYCGFFICTTLSLEAGYGSPSCKDKSWFYILLEDYLS